MELRQHIASLESHAWLLFAMERRIVTGVVPYYLHAGLETVDIGLPPSVLMFWFSCPGPPQTILGSPQWFAVEYSACHRFTRQQQGSQI